MEMTCAKATALAARALPDLIPPRDPSAGWARPRPLPAARPRSKAAPGPQPVDGKTGTGPASDSKE
ncbi:hypothetical protein GCM10010508_62960 [Streptomyces naganishii JCM 4654]|uniref:Uncharacterized protein n=1 Tax=Streptomyces naganishii JCM 4654 TaxID=1306179 RepID=A0A918YAK9_9ACTN|nr:hypothetical protein GCM10010508_62960 [Streptomyces naganishii JCM 4654]